MSSGAETENSADPQSEFQKVGQFRHVLSSVLGFVAAFFCAICVLYLSLVVVFPFVVPVLAGLMFGRLPVNSPVSFAIVSLASSLFFFSGMVIGRFLLRAIPPRLSGKRRYGVIVFLAAITIWYLVAVYLRVFHGVGAASPPPGIDQSLVDDIQRLNSSALYQLFQFLPLVFWWLGFAVPLATRHWNPRRSLEEPFVLFLRRFSSFPDRSIQHALLKCTPAGKPLAFLTPTGSRAGDWNPFRVGFSGIKLWRPIRSMPVILRSTNEDWKAAATDLIDHAQVVVLDVSEGSGAIQAEIDMIDAADRWQDAVILTKNLKPRTDEAERIDQFAARGATVIGYKKSWIRALPRLLLGPFATILVIVPLFYLVPMLVRVLMNTDSLAGAGNPLVSPADIQALGFFDFSSTYLFIVNVVIGTWIYFVFFVRPALNKGAVKSLSKVLRQR